MKKFLALSVLFATQAATATSPSMVLDSLGRLTSSSIGRIEDGHVTALFATPVQGQKLSIHEYVCKPGIVEKLADCQPESKRQLTIGSSELKGALRRALRGTRVLSLAGEQNEGLLKLYRQSPENLQDSGTADSLRIVRKNKADLEKYIAFAKRNGGSAADVESQSNNLKTLDTQIARLESDEAKMAPIWDAMREVELRVNAFVDNLTHPDAFLLMPNSRDSKTLEYQMARYVVMDACEVVAASTEAARAGVTCQLSAEGYISTAKRFEVGSYERGGVFGLGEYKWMGTGVYGWDLNNKEFVNADDFEKVKKAESISGMHKNYEAFCMAYDLEPISWRAKAAYADVIATLFGPGTSMICISKWIN